MKKILSMLIALAFLASTVTICEAGSSAIIDVSATVPSGLELDWGMAKVDSKLTDDNGADDTWTPNQTEMAYGDLRYTLGNGDNAGLWFSQYYFALFMSVIAGGSKYKIQHSSAGLSQGGIKLPKGWGIPYIACWDTDNDQEKDCPSGSGLGNLGPAERTFYLYDSGVGAEVVTIRADYAIPPKKASGDDPFPNFEKIPLSQKAGPYAGTVEITATTY